jgi:hypothetical protein
MIFISQNNIKMSWPSEKNIMQLYRATTSANDEKHSVFDLGEVEWNVYNEQHVEIILLLLNVDIPIVCKITNIPQEITQEFAKELQGDDMTFGDKWKSWTQDNAKVENAREPVMTTVQDSMRNGKILWDGIRRTFSITDESLTGVAVVGNILKRCGQIRTPAHWHGPAVINVHLHGSCTKSYEFVPWDTMVNEFDYTSKNLSKLSLHSSLPERKMRMNMNKAKDLGKFHYYTAKIGEGLPHNCIIWPQGMLHEILTECVRTRNCTNTNYFLETDKKSLYLGFGTYVIFNDKKFISDTVQFLQELESNQGEYKQWLQQIKSENDRRTIYEKLHSLLAKIN